MRTLRRSLLAAVPLLLGAGSLSAQSYIGVNPVGYVPGVTFQARNLTNLSGTDDAFIANSVAELGSAATRDSYIGTWAGARSPRHYEFLVEYSAAANTLTFTMSHVLSAGAGADNSGAISSSVLGKVFTVTNPAPHEAFRLYTAQNASLKNLKYDGVAYTGFGAFPQAIAGNNEFYWDVNETQDWRVFGELDLTIVGTDPNANRFEVGVALSSVPEPSTYALMATGLLALVGVARRRREV
jgi:hypothetical protein